MKRYESVCTMGAGQPGLILGPACLGPGLDIKSGSLLIFGQRLDSLVQNPKPSPSWVERVLVI